MNIGNKLRILAAGAVLSFPLGAMVCNETNRSAIERSVMEDLSTRQKALEKKEHKLAERYIDMWADFMDRVLSHLEEGIDDIKEKQKFKKASMHLASIVQELVDEDIRTRYGRNGFEAITGKVKEIFRGPSRPIERTEPPTEIRQKAFTKLVGALDEIALSFRAYFDLSSDEIIKKCANTLPKGEFGTTDIEIYKELQGILNLEISSLIQEIEEFNRSAKSAGQPLYEGVYEGLNLEKLKSLKSIK